ncbi:DUF4226 domain-containing protein [Mycobacterium cookii]|uniref:Biofilm regulator BssS n=1 Tax=Mycobacterium cookii TaxID=1775 RepID=A0A7I7KYE9_9MYCO|nr:DUF4226 domain-containing protein [Mycobacterium cookii]MCV7333309.1 DUF4226 domain-containing protein [Mycobacterium cookii]BBX47095.1 hypothetical protein MCOO_31100 [Mycobacterium cookii]
MPDDVVGDGHQEGDAADAIRNAEVALAHQNSTTAQVDLQVVTAVLSAHQKAAAGKDALTRLQRDIEGAVVTRSDLDTPAGARDFQRFLIGKLRDIRAVVAGASLDDTSNSALMAAWTSLYNAGQPGDGDDAGKSPPAAAGAQTGSAATEPELEPYLDDEPLADDVPTQTAPSAAPTPAQTPSLPAFGGGGLPGGATMPGLGSPGGFALPGPLSASDASPKDDALRESDEPEDPSDGDGHDETEPVARPAHSGPTTVTLPDGETLTAASPQLAAAIEAAAAGTPIAEAFQHEGITIPPPGTAVSDPVDPAHLAPGDIGMFTDRHALALGESRALVNGQIQHISTVTGPGFLGWEHPPVPVSAPDKTDPPAPTRPASADRTEPA